MRTDPHEMHLDAYVTAASECRKPILARQPECVHIVSQSLINYWFISCLKHNKNYQQKRQNERASGK